MSSVDTIALQTLAKSFQKNSQHQYIRFQIEVMVVLKGVAVIHLPYQFSM